MDFVRTASADGVAVVTLDRPPVNAFSVQMWEELSATLGRLGDDPEVRAIVLTAAGQRAFSAGADVRESATFDAEQERHRQAVVHAGLGSLWAVPVPLICAINAPAVGGGLNLTTLCDYRIAARTATFALPEIRHGRHGGGGVFVRRIGVPTGVARMLLYTGRALSAAEALAAHLVDEVVEPDALVPAATDLAAAIAAHDRDALCAVKRAVRATEPGWEPGYAAAGAAANGMGANGRGT